MATTLEIADVKHDVHTEEDVYGEDYVITFEAGRIDDPAGYSAALVMARVLPEHRCPEGQSIAELSGLWTFPPVRDGREFKTELLESADPIDIDQLRAAAKGLVEGLRATLEEDCDKIRERFQQIGQGQTEG